MFDASYVTEVRNIITLVSVTMMLHLSVCSETYGASGKREKHLNDPTVL
jgi:hypothetical protein